MRHRDCQCLGPALESEGSEEHVPLDNIVEECSGLGAADGEADPKQIAAQEPICTLRRGHAAAVEARPPAQRQRKTSSHFATAAQKDERS